MNSPRFVYSAKEFEDHVQTLRVEIPKEEAEAHFLRQYSQPEEARWKLARFLAACSYLDRYRDAFGRHYGFTQDGEMFSRHIVGAVWRYFNKAPNEVLAQEPPVRLILALAEENEREDL